MEQPGEQKARPLRHYCVVRQDLPLGQKFAQLGHAAGESAFEFGVGDVLPEASRRGRFIGLAYFIALEGELNDMSAAINDLRKRGIAVSVITECEGPWIGQTLAFGVEPTSDNRVRKILYHFKQAGS